MEAPTTIDGARVLKVADLVGTTCTGRTEHFRDGALQAGFERLALARYEGDDGVYLFYCDASWNVLNDTHHDDLISAEDQAAFEYDGVTFIDL